MTKKIQHLIDHLNQLTSKRYYLKVLSNSGHQLINQDFICILGGPFGTTPRELKNLIEAYIKGIKKL
jgi:hypothetical protein